MSSDTGDGELDDHDQSRLVIDTNNEIRPEDGEQDVIQ